jgi:hypothetical protein
LRLENFTVAWNVLEGIIAVGARVLAGSPALIGFGVDSAVESVSGGVLIWRLRVEQTGQLTQPASRPLNSGPSAWLASRSSRSRHTSPSSRSVTLARLGLNALFGWWWADEDCPPEADE